MKTLSIDIETFSSINLLKSGVYRYSESDDFEILLFSYSIDNGPVITIDLANEEKIPQEIIHAIVSNDVIKWAFNASFERICLSRFLGLPKGEYLSPLSWRCSMVWSAYLSFPLSLEGVGAVLGLEKQKLKEGKELIKYFCTPCASTIKNGNRIRNLPCHDAEKWKLFKSYNKRDVEVELGIKEKLSKFPVPDEVWEEYAIDQEINDRGVLIDMNLVESAIKMNEISSEEIKQKMISLTNLENPNSVAQLKIWLKDNGVSVEALGKKNVKELLSTPLAEDVEDVLKLRLQLSKSSIKKYEAMINTVCSDGRARGMFQFYGANRTGRWSGRLIQLQNLPRNQIDDLPTARNAIKLRDYDFLSSLYDDIPSLLSQLVRTAFIAKEGTRFIVSDYSAVEARVIAWYAKEAWRQKVFHDGGDIYSESASKMFGVPVGKHGPNAELRQKGKIAELALGYGGSVGALKAMGALEMGLKEEELKPLVTSWRQSNPMIVKFWWAVDSAAKEAIKNKTTVSCYGLKFSYQSGFLCITLPSNRKLFYVKPKIARNQYGSESITYEGIGATKKWERIETYGPKLVENIVQATSRDLIAFSMKNLKDLRIEMHIHDELVIEAMDEIPLNEIVKVMSKSPDWADDLGLNADGYETEFYMKD